MFQSTVSLLRIKHWLKNLFVFLPILFSGELTNITILTMAISVFFSFSFMASAVYAFNDIIDAEDDRKNPRKKDRPVTSGELSKRYAAGVAICLCILSLVLADSLSEQLIRILLIYLGMSLLYCVTLKNIVILDVMVIAIGYVLRILAGASVSQLAPSHWILMTTFFLALFLGFSKRRAEFAFDSESLLSQRKVFKDYTIGMLDQILSATMSITIICYSLYASSDYVRTRFQTDNLIYTVPFVVFGVFYYFQQMQVAKKGEDPADMLLHNRPTLVNLIIWVIICVLIIY
jgi:4-hydroxybenzoate polyprenyltransferase